MTNGTVLNATLRYAQTGLTPIPLHGKIPQLNDWQKLRHPTTAVIQEWHDKGLLDNVGLVCGSASKNLVVMDFDGLEGYAAFAEQFPALVDTYTVLTGSGKGMHVYLYVEQLPKSVKAMNTPFGNIEICADGRQVVAPPSIHPTSGKVYEVHQRKAIHAIPHVDEVVAWVNSFKKGASLPPPRETMPPKTTTGNYAQRAFESELAAVLSTREGGRNEQLNKSAFNLGQFVGGGSLDRFSVENALRNAALAAGLEQAEIEATIRSGIESGMEQPRSIPEQTPRPATNGAKPTPEAPPPVDVSQILVPRSAVLTRYQERLSTIDIPAAEPILFPLTVLHDLGGMARVIKPGKLAAVVGVSGTGKTSLLETMIDGWMRMGKNVLVWSPEWSPEEFADRAIQRYGGLTAESMYLFELYKAETARGVEQYHRQGTNLQPEAIAKALELSEELMGWKGETIYINHPELSVDQLTELLPGMVETAGIKLHAIVIDYAQLLHAMERGDMPMYQMLMRLKAACVANNLVGLIASQTTKASAKDSDKFSELLDASSARFVNDDPFNLFVTLNLEKDEDGKFKDTAVLNVVKNSLGRRGKVRVGVNFARLTWLDKKSENQRFD